MYFQTRISCIFLAVNLELVRENDGIYKWIEAAIAITLISATQITGIAKGIAKYILDHLIKLA